MAGPTARQRSEKKIGSEKVGGEARAWLCAVAVVMLVATFAARSARGVDDLATLQKRFDQETDGVHKAKLLVKLGDLQFDAERQAAKSSDYVNVGVIMEKYRDNVRIAVQALKKTHPDGEKHPGGYRELEMSTGRGLREIRDVILTMPEDLRPPMQLVERDLIDLDNELLRQLFPRRPGEKPPLEQGASTPKKTEKPPEKQP
jgi:hypothetical protein